jgi:hypothetical protein
VKNELLVQEVFFFNKIMMIVLHKKNEVMGQKVALSLSLSLSIYIYILKIPLYRDFI